MQRIISIPSIAEDYQALFNFTFEQASDGLAHLSLDGQWIRCNNTLCEMFGLSQDELLKLSFQEVLWRADVSLNPLAQMQKREVQSFQMQKFCVRKNGEKFWVAIHLALIASTDNSSEFILLRVEDLQSHKTHEEELQRSKAQLQSVLDNVDVGIITADLQGNILYWNPTSIAMHGFENEAGTSQQVEQMQRLFQLSTPDGALLESNDWPLTRILRGEKLEGEVLLIRRLDKDWEKIFSYRGSLVLNQQGLPMLAILAIDDVTLQTNAEQYAYLAYHDSLTGLANRRHLTMKLESSLDRARRRKEILAVLFMDLDHFKEVNDTLGHESGDQLLKAVVGRLQGRLRKDDFIARLGGDEFVLVMDDEVSEQHVGNLASALIQLISCPFVLSDNHSVQIGLSIGIAFFPTDGYNAELLLQHADEALYQSKEAGRGTWTAYERLT